MNIDIKDLNSLKELLEKLKDNEACFINEDGISKYAIINIETYDLIEDFLKFKENKDSHLDARIVGSDDIELSYEEYENIKKQILEALEKSLLPKPEKLN